MSAMLAISADFLKLTIRLPLVEMIGLLRKTPENLRDLRSDAH
jgi:hypothetical protein